MMRLCCLSLTFQPQFTARQIDDFSFVDLCASLQLDGVDFNNPTMSLEDIDRSLRAMLATGVS